MAITMSGVQEFTDAQLLILYRWGLANGAAGQSRQIEGRTITFPPINELRKTIDWLEGREDQSGTIDDSIALVRFGQHR